MSEPTPPDGQPPAVPPRFDERSTGRDHTGDDATAPVDQTPERTTRPNDADAAQHHAPGAPPADATVVFPAGAATNPAAAPLSANQPPNGPPNQPAGQYPSAPPPGQNPPAQYPPAQPPGVASGPPPGTYPPGVPPTGPGGPGYGGPPPSSGPQYGGPGGADEPPEKKSGLLLAGLIALVVALVGALGFVALQAGDDDDAEPVTTSDDRDDPDEPNATVETTEPAVTPPPTAAPTTTTTTTTTVPVVADGSVDAVFVRVEALPAVIAEADLDTTIQRIGLTEGNNPVATADPVLNLCAALPVDAPVSATVTWMLDNEVLSEGEGRVFATPADGNCINNSGEPLASGSYEVSFSDSAGSMSGVALFTVGAATVNQEFLNDTDADLCAVELAPTAAGFFQPFEVNNGEPLVPGDSILIDIAEVEHEVRGIDCADAPSESFFASPSPDPISLTSGTAVPATTTTTTTEPPPPPPQITDDELGDVDGEIGSLDVAVPNGSDDEQVVIDLLLDPETSLRIATEEQSLALCAAWDVAGPLEAEMVWEFNRAVIARFPVSTEGGRVGRCIPPGGAAFDEGAYQVYLERGDFLSEVETFTVGRAQTQLAFRNDTGVAVCRVGFSPNLTNWYTFLEFADSADFEESVDPGDAFTIVAPFIENDIRAFDCDGNQVSEATAIPPTDQTLNLSTGRP